MWWNKIKEIFLRDLYVSELCKAQFYGEPSFPHGISGIFISSNAKIGHDCVIFHQVTIGSNTLADSKGFGSPIIGNNVYIGCGAKIIGNVRVGDNCRIGANCVITQNISDNCTVVFEKPQIIMHTEKKCNVFSQAIMLTDSKML